MKKCENCKSNEVDEKIRDVCEDCVVKVIKEGRISK